MTGSDSLVKISVNGMEVGSLLMKRVTWQQLEVFAEKKPIESVTIIGDGREFGVTDRERFPLIFDFVMRGPWQEIVLCVTTEGHRKSDSRVLDEFYEVAREEIHWLLTNNDREAYFKRSTRLHRVLDVCKELGCQELEAFIHRQLGAGSNSDVRSAMKEAEAFLDHVMLELRRRLETPTTLTTAGGGAKSALKMLFLVWFGLTAANAPVEALQVVAVAFMIALVVHFLSPAPECRTYRGGYAAKMELVLKAYDADGFVRSTVAALEHACVENLHTFASKSMKMPPSESVQVAGADKERRMSYESQVIVSETAHFLWTFARLRRGGSSAKSSM